MDLPNHLGQEKSPYLRQHAHNPVQWYPWGEEAFALARRRAKPIFLSIGYSTCHWCHVMERESFENEATAALLNEHFISIKVDREERPDVDRVYMSAVQAMSGQGGWPLSVFLTPDLKPFFGGTYFPPEPRWGQPGFPQLLTRIADLWRARRADIAADAERVTKALKEFAAAAGTKAPLNEDWLARGFKALSARFDAANGGFGDAPKFPMPVNLDFLLAWHARSGEPKALTMAVATLKAMAKGGVHDQVGGGFSRYSTDERWFLPHFEKMLYDNAQLAVTYLDAFKATRDEELAWVARDTLDYILRDLASARGGLFSAEDADSLEPGESPDGSARKYEGAFYLWSRAELDKVLGKEDAALFAFRYGIEAEGNIEHDPHGEFKGKNLPYQAASLTETAVHFKVGQTETARRLGSARKRLLEARSQRPRPSLDDKVLVSWNGLALSAFAKGHQMLGDARYLEAARRAGAFLRDYLWDEASRTLRRRWAGGESAVAGNADDYAFLVQGLLDLYEADFEPGHLEWALDLTQSQDRLFAGKDGGYFMTAEDADPHLLARFLEDADNVEPCASSVAVSNLLRLAEFTGREDLRRSAEKTLAFFSGRMAERPLSLPRMLTAAGAALRAPMQVVLAGDLGRGAGFEMLKEVRERLLRPHALIAIPNAKTHKKLYRLSPGLEAFVPPREGATAYVCFDFRCEKPTSDPAALRDSLKAASKPV